MTDWDNRERNIGTVVSERCERCGKGFNGVAVNIHGSLDYIRHKNVAFNAAICVIRAKGDEKKLVEEIFALISREYPIGEDVLGIIECIKYDGINIMLGLPPGIPRDVMDAVQSRLAWRQELS
jgi:hypothetical protein